MTCNISTVFLTRGTYKSPGGLEVGPPVVEGPVGTPVVEGSEVGVALDDDSVEGGVSKAEYGVTVERLEASAVVGKSSQCKESYTQSSVIVAKYT